MGLYPLFAELDGREVLVVGGGEVAARKVAALLKAGARVRLHALEVLHEDLAAALAAGRIARLGGDFDPAWLDTAWLVVAATDDVAFNAGLAAEAGRRRRLINVVDDAALSTFQVPAVVDRAPLVLAISSAGTAPMLARRIREKLETLVDPSLGTLAALFGRHRERIRAQLPDTSQRRRWFERMLDGCMEQAYEGGGAARAEALFLEELENAAGAVEAAGSVALVAASHAPDLYTLRALRALNEADVIVCMDGIDDAALEPARRDARHIRAADPEAAAQRALQLAQEGARVVLLHGAEGAAAACERLEQQCAQARIACRRIPGIA
ncbi:NAD(P)-dependent oxidoreductase [Pseudoxanthomonas koreensis]|uniref:NAD(P)-dependent oxidoreductase n=1 Tax=Pseudoxanthomonas koreensis TaxID=266061 RepID=UPI0013909489|nr:NAD(P)-dependent oxidoreductase [Pseudoxanthomonas koreensis]KAF1695257.1 siroheme synthase [Pseudoxanthomonas koreensis]